MAAIRTLLVISSDPEGPVVRHRWRAYEKALRASDIGLEVAPWPKARGTRQETLARAGAAAGVVISSRLLAGRHVAALRQATPALAFDFDDALPYRDSSRGATRSATRTKRFEAILAAADRVMAGNAYLAQLVEATGRTATTLPTTVAVDEQVPPPSEDPRPARIAFIGSRSTIAYLESLGEALEAVARGSTPFRLRVIADVPPRLPAEVDVEFVPWALDTWRASLEGADFGLAPLPDDPWSRGKCGLRLLQTLAAGRAVVAAPVGVQAEQVRDGVTGLLATEPADWCAATAELLDDRERRVAMGAAGHADVLQRWSVRAWTPAVVEEVEQLLAGVRT